MIEILFFIEVKPVFIEQFLYLSNIKEMLIFVGSPLWWQQAMPPATKTPASRKTAEKSGWVPIFHFENSMNTSKKHQDYYSKFKSEKLGLSGLWNQSSSNDGTC